MQIVATERQGHNAEQIRKAIPNAEYPVCAGGAGAYNGGKGIPYCYVIGVEGKILYEGSPGGKADTIIDEEIKKIKYPGLGKLDVVKDLEKAAKSFVAGKLDKAREDAQKEIEDLKKKAGIEGETALDESKLDEEGKAVFADANFIIGRVNSTLETLTKRAESAKESKEYKNAHDAYSKISSLFGSSDDGKKAKDAAGELMKDKDIKKEIKAQEKLDELLNGQKFKGSTPERQANLLKDFVKANKGTRAAEKAEAKLPAE